MVTRSRVSKVSRRTFMAGAAGGAAVSLISGVEMVRLVGQAANDNKPGGGWPSGGALSPARDHLREILDHIAQCEGTADQLGRGYNTSLGYGRFLPGRTELQLTTKSLTEILQLGHYMRRQPGNPNSSALGRYQIVGMTLKGLMAELGLAGHEVFDATMQDRMALVLVRRRGATVALGQEWASLRGRKLAKAIALVRKLPR